MVLIPVDLGDKNALHSLISASNQISQDDTVHMLHVLPAPAPDGPTPLRADLKRLSAERLRLAKLAVEAGLGRAHVEVRYGLFSIAREVNGYARRAGVTRIVVPSRQRAGLNRLFNGSVAAKIAREAKVPVEVVPMVSPRRAMAAH